jgi:hypothetical protein
MQQTVGGMAFVWAKASGVVNRRAYASTVVASLREASFLATRGTCPVLPQAYTARTSESKNRRMRLVASGLGVRVANASVTLTGVLTPLRREADTVKASTCSSLSLRGVVPRNARNLPCPTPSLHRANQRIENRRTRLVASVLGVRVANTSGA